MHAERWSGGLARFLTIRLHRRGIFVAGGAAIVAAIGAVIQSRRNARLARSHLYRRLPEIRAQLAEAAPGFVLLAGNSHAEIVGDELARLMPMVNAGIGGTSARGYAAHLDELPFRTRAGVAVLMLGTNDILRKAEPLSERTQARFRASMLRVVSWLQANANLVLVAAVPPLGPEAATVRDPAAVEAYNAVLRELCAACGCRFFDPFAGLRDSGEGLTTQAIPDGVHLRDYGALAADLVPLLSRVSEADAGSLRDWGRP